MPVLAWFLFGTFLTALAWQLKRTLAFKATIFSWLAFLLYFADEPRSLMRSFLPIANIAEGKRIRIVSLNCNSGDPLVVTELVAFQPDIVLLQESPSKADVDRLAFELFGKQAAVLWGVDASIIARGTIKATKLSDEESIYFVQGRVHLPDGYQLEVVSLRLMTPPFRIDLWSPTCWKAYRDNRQIQRTQMRGVKNQFAKNSGNIPLIVGGDFNAPQGDSIFSYLSDLGMNDSFKLAGRGWGNTIINDFPALRIDQIWANQFLKPINVTARKSLISDHRAVIADFERN
jgi:vancomycin resistance protein VanJ